MRYRCRSNKGEIKMSISRVRLKQIIREELEKFGSNMSLTNLAHIANKALDQIYHYGVSEPGMNFGWLSTIESVKAAKKLIDAGETDIEVISDAIHEGWNKTAIADYLGKLNLDTPTPKEKKEERYKKAQTKYNNLSEDDKEKDRVVARVLLKKMGKQNNGDTSVNIP